MLELEGSSRQASLALSLGGFMLWLSGMFMGGAIVAMFVFASQIEQMQDDNAVTNIYVTKLDAMMRAEGYPAPDLAQIRDELEEEK